MNETQNKLINATERLLHANGLARLTTRDIAREAGVAEGLIYHHFKDKAELIHEVVERRMNSVKNLLDRLPLQVGLRTVDENLEEVLQITYSSQYQVIPIICSVFADHKLQLSIQKILEERKIGPQSAIETLALYLSAEQRLGRITDDTVPLPAAKLLWMLCFQLALEDRFSGREMDMTRTLPEIRGAMDIILPQPRKRRYCRRKGAKNEK